MDKLEQKEMKKIRSIKNNWYDCLINYILELIRETVGGFKDKIVSLFNIRQTYLSKQCMGEKRN